jgi:DNA replicative helicase MCM subunit Mcm2 (Cdc46/Mcm family)
MPSNIISRFDYLSVIEEDIGSQTKKGREIIKARSRSDKQLNSTIAKYCQRNNIEFARFIKILIGYITTEYEHIDLTSVLKRIDREYKRLLKENDDIHNLSKYSGRISTSIHKFVVAATRIQLREKANRNAVNMAVGMLEQKLEFLRQWHSATGTTASNASVKGKSAFTKCLVKQYGAKKFSRERAVERCRECIDPCVEVSDSTLRNWIGSLADSERQNKWSIRKEILEHFKVW